MKPIKIAIAPGHGYNQDYGATNRDINVREYDVNKFLSTLFFRKIVENKNFEVKYFERKQGQKTMIANINRFEPDLAIEFHMNAYNRMVRGYEILLKNNYNFLYEDIMKDFLENLCEIDEEHDMKNRGIKVVVRNESRGGRFCYGVKADLAMILELGFIDNIDDLASVLRNRKTIIDHIYDFCLDFWSVKLVENE